jgi:TPR repeat protein
MYGTGQGVPLDLAAAAQWYTRAADQGSVAAQYMLGVVYSKGQGVTRDSGTAIQWYTRAAEQGSPSAQYILGVIYEKGQGVVVPDEEEAFKWYMRAAEGGHADAQYDLALKYMIGEAVEKDFVKAYTWCLLAGLNQKNVAKREKWLEERMTADQLEEARRCAREFIERDSQEVSTQ